MSGRNKNTAPAPHNTQDVPLESRHLRGSAWTKDSDGKVVPKRETGRHKLTPEA